MKEGFNDKHNDSDENVKTVVKKWHKEESKEFYDAGIQALIWRRSIPILRSRDVIHRGLALFLCMIYALELVIILY